MIPTGKGTYLWIVDRCDPSESKADLVNQLITAGIQRVDLKIVNGVERYNIDEKTGFDHNKATIDACRAAGITVIPWAYTYGVSRDWVTREANAVIEAMQEYGLTDTFIVNAESEYKRGKEYGKYADIYCKTIKEATGCTLGLSSYRWPSYHMDFPWSAFWPYVDFHAPQVYWLGAHNSAAQLNKSVNELRAMLDVPIVPTGLASYDAVAADMDAFDAEAQRLELPGVSWWEWYYILNNASWYSAISSHDWCAVPVPPVVEPPVIVDPPTPPVIPSEIDALYSELTIKIDKITHYITR
jgi:hypothetical protein